MNERGFPRIRPNVPGPIASRFAHLRRHLEEVALNRRLSLSPFEDVDISGQAWVWNLYGQNQGGHFCIQTVIEGANAGRDASTVVLYCWRDSADGTDGRWVSAFFWNVDDDLRLKAILYDAYRYADMPPLPPKEVVPAKPALALVP